MSLSTNGPPSAFTAAPQRTIIDLIRFPDAQARRANHGCVGLGW